MKKRHLASLAAFALVAVPTIAHADPLAFTLDNKSSHNILYIYLSTPDATDWGDDILGDNVLVPAGESGTVTIKDAAGQCDFAMEFILDTKQVITETSVSLCDNATYTLSDSQ
ncbi:hypothetical protein [Devosia sp.]|uniref:hypothetical protein n=1 Tax=Devosia sp. TaxID=1871048 RepID=UPI0032675782